MLYYNENDASQGIDMIKANTSKECDICHCWYFFKKGFKFKPHVCNSNIYILNIKNGDYRRIITGISKSEGIKLLQNIDLTEKK